MSQTTPPIIRTGREIYDFIMKDIEGELCTDQLNSNMSSKKNESLASRKNRAKRYEKAFQEYDRRFTAYSKKWKQDFAKFRRAAFRFLETSFDTASSSSLQSLLSAIHDA